MAAILCPLWALAGRTWAVGLLLVQGHLKIRDVAHVHSLQHLLGVGVNLNDVLLNGRHLGYVVVSALPLLFLQLDGDAAYRAALDALHKVGHKPSNLVPQLFTWDDCDFLTYSLI